MSKINFDVIPQCGAGMTDIEKMARLFSETFQGRIDAYGEGAGLCTKQNVTDEVIKAHLTGKKRIGRYPLAPNILGGSGTWWAAADVDEDQLTLAIEFGGYLWHIGIPCYIERSKSKGYHVWTFFSEPVPASTARAIMLNAVELLERDADYKVKEVFPKQTTIKNPDGTYGFGNYINLPLFGGDVPNGRTVFLNPDDGYNPYADQWAFLQTIRKLSSQELTEIVRDCLTEPTISPKTQTAIITPQVDSVARQTTRQNQKSGDDVFRGMLSKATKDFIANGAPAGERNARLFKAACDFVGCLELLDTAVAVLLPPALKSGLTQSEAIATIKSAFAKPRTPSSPDALLPTVDFKIFHRTDLGNAELLDGFFGHDLRYDHTRKKWFVWTGNRWEMDRRDLLERMAERTARRRLKLAADLFEISPDAEERAECQAHMAWAVKSESRERINAALDLAQSVDRIAVTGDDWDADKWLLGVGDGVVDLRTGEFREGRREDSLTLSTNVAYDPQATCPRWRKFLDEIFNDNFELSDYIQRAVGYSLSGNVREHCLFLCYGTGRNGKSVFLNTIASMLGDYATGTPFSTFEMSRYQSQSTNDLAALRGKRFVSARETQEARRLNEARVKAVTGGDPITARFLYAEFFTYFPQFKFWLAVNHKPIIRDTSEGMWSRVRLIPFTVSFRGREDKKLEDTLRGELPGILGWALAGCRKWQELDGLAEPQVVIRATKEYKEESDPVGVFLAECTEPKPNFSATTDAKALYDFYVSWCEDAGEEPLSQTAFGRRLAEKGYEKIRTSNGRNAYRGIDVVGSKATTETE